MKKNNRAESLIRLLELIPHPEGGFYREVFRSQERVRLEKKNILHHAISDIFYLLIRAHASRFHRILQDEIWHFYEGNPLEITEISPATLKVSKTVIGNTNKVLRYKHVVRAGNWQASRTLGAYSLVGCTVAPGFEFKNFELLNDNRPMCAEVVKKYPELKKLI